METEFGVFKIYRFSPILNMMKDSFSAYLVRFMKIFIIMSVHPVVIGWSKSAILAFPVHIHICSVLPCFDETRRTYCINLNSPDVKRRVF